MAESLHNPQEDLYSVLLLATQAIFSDVNTPEEAAQRVSYLRAPDGAPLPMLIFSLADVDFYDTIDGRFIGLDSVYYRIQIWTNDRDQMDLIFIALLEWLLNDFDTAVPSRSYSLLPIRAGDTPHVGFQDRGVYERNLILQYTLSE